MTCEQELAEARKERDEARELSGIIVPRHVRSLGAQLAYMKGYHLARKASFSRFAQLTEALGFIERHHVKGVVGCKECQQTATAALNTALSR